MSGALPINYVKLWEYPGYKGVYVPSKMLKQSKDDPTIGSEYWQLFPNPRDLSDAPKAFPSYEERRDFPNLSNFARTLRLIRSIQLSDTHRFYDATTTLPAPQREEPDFLYAVGAEPRNILDSITRRYTSHFFHYVGQPQTYQEDAQDSQKREISERFAVFVDSIISKFDTLYQYEDPPVDDIQYAEHFIKDFASYINHDIFNYIDMLDMVDIKIDEDDYISIKWERDGRSLYFEIKDEYVYFTKLWFQDGRLISSDGTLTKEMYRETWKWIINGNL